MVRANSPPRCDQGRKDPQNLLQRMPRDSARGTVGSMETPEALEPLDFILLVSKLFPKPRGIKTLELFATYSSATPHSWPVDLDRLLSSWKEESSLD